MKRRVLLTLLALLLAGIAFLAWSGPMSSGLPTFDAAEYTPIGPKVPEDPVTLTFGQREGLKLFGGVPRDRKPLKWVVSGNLRLFEEGRQVLEIDVFSNPGGPGPFRIGKNYFLGYDQTAFQELLNPSDPPR